MASEYAWLKEKKRYTVGYLLAGCDCITDIDKRKKQEAKLSPTPHKDVFVSRTKFPVFLPKASQGDSLAAFYGFNTRNF